MELFSEKSSFVVEKKRRSREHEETRRKREEERNGAKPKSSKARNREYLDKGFDKDVMSKL
ncbi:hypothetical protein QG37_03113 [Candidozyma auris]|uniref:Uncharacterized protein n=1 Tax=Candidozyma auris TaxID=498019 RepID=A0A0L0NZV6_CANAR|nr:hypothetical protein QG37_03113 [[Candida] auris]